MQIKLSYLEIYNESIIDLLNPIINNNLEIREHSTRGIHIPNLTEEMVKNLNDAE